MIIFNPPSAAFGGLVPPSARGEPGLFNPPSAALSDVRYPWLLFDLDGTLLDYDAAEAAALKSCLEDLEVTLTDEMAAVYRKVNRALWRRFERGEVTADGIRDERFRVLVDELTLEADPAELSRRYIGHLARSTHVIAGAREVVEQLRGRHRIGLVTNGLSDVQRPRIEATGFGALADVIVISDEEGTSKPDPRFFDVAFERMGAPDKDEVIVIGDSLTSDMTGGAAYGLDTCWVNPAGRPNDVGIPVTYEIGELTALPPIVA